MRARRLRWTPHDIGLYFHNGMYFDGQFQHHPARTWRDLVWDFVFIVGLPMLAFVSVVVLIWILLAVGRAVRSIGGIA